MSKSTEYETRRNICVDIATNKAKRHGESTWAFDYRGQQVQVTAKEKNGSVRVSTQHVKNKGK
jgi:hypothetical protein